MSTETDTKAPAVRKTVTVHIGGLVVGVPSPSKLTYTRPVVQAMIDRRKEAGLSSLLLLERPTPVQALASSRSIAQTFLGFVKDLWLDDGGRLLAKIRLKNEWDALSLNARMRAMGWDSADDSTIPSIVDPLGHLMGAEFPESGGEVPLGWDLIYLFLRPLNGGGKITCPECGTDYESKNWDNLGRVRLPNSHLKKGAGLDDGFCPGSGKYLDLDDNLIDPQSLLDGKVMTDAEVKQEVEEKTREKRRVGTDTDESLGVFLERKKDEYTRAKEEACASWAAHMIRVIGDDALALPATVGDVEDFEVQAKGLIGKSLTDLKRMDEELANKHKLFNKARGIERGP